MSPRMHQEQSDGNSVSISSREAETEIELDVPTIDLRQTNDEADEDDDDKHNNSDNNPTSIVTEIARACQEYGFFQVINHGISPQLVDEYSEQCRLYFALPLSVKQQWKRHDGNSRGWFNDELTKQKRDWKEALDMGVPGTRDWNVLPDDDPSNHCLDGWNQLPSSDVLPNFRLVLTKYFDECAKLADRIAVLMAQGLGQDFNSPLIRDLREQHSSYLRSNYYPLCNELEEDGVTKPLGISPHRDAGFLTVLLQDIDCHSLQVWKDDRWVTIHPEPYAFTINTGDMAEVWSNGRYQAPLHRVLSNETQERYSTPFFYNPSYSTIVKPLSVASSTNEDSANRNQDPIYHGVLWGYFRAVRFAGDLTDLGVEIQVADFLKSDPSVHVRNQQLFAEQADFEVPFSVEKYRPLLQYHVSETFKSTRKRGKTGISSREASSMVSLLAVVVLIAMIFLPAVQCSTRSTSVSRSPFNKERTSVSGFGSRSIKKTIFPQTSSSWPTSLKTLRRDSDIELFEDERDPDVTSDHQNMDADMQFDEEDEKGDDDMDLVSLAPGISQQLWVQRSNDDPGVLWVLVGSESKNFTLELTVSKVTEDFQIERKKPSRSFLSQYPMEQWVPIEGFYGLYRVPSGILWVLVSKTEPVYSAPALVGITSSSSWWEIRRIVNLEIVHLNRPASSFHCLTPLQLREEARQLRLLRKALKQHDFYYVSSSGIDQNESSMIVRDMTNSLQRCFLAHVENDVRMDSSSTVWWNPQAYENDSPGSLPDPRFFWNQHAVEPLVQRYQSCSRISPKRKLFNVLLRNVLPVTSAFVGVQQNITVDTSDKRKKQTQKSSPQWSYDQVLISRRSRFRAGTRYTVRGADSSGAVANFVETEQIILLTKDDEDLERHLHSVASHVQIRGSIPLRWSSPADVKTYRPRVRIGTDPLAQARALRLHLLEQLSHYKVNDGRFLPPNIADVVFVNLVDKESDQGRLGKAFDSVLQAVMDVYSIENVNLTSAMSSDEISDAPFKSYSFHHLWYDFHSEVKQGRWDRLAMLLDDVKPSLTSHAYFLANAPTKNEGWSVKGVQNAVVRTNCMDCLDRTNVVQSIFGRYMLFQQLIAQAENNDFISLSTNVKKRWAKFKKQFQKHSLSLPWENGEIAHRLLWADNADAISRLYAGTPALKGDFTRTGKRTKRGALDDGMNSLQRYYLNNFLDADRQEGCDLMVGYSNFSNVGEVPLEEEELVYEETDDSSDGNSTSARTHVYPGMSIHESARAKMLKEVVQGESYENRQDVRHRLEDVGIAMRSHSNPVEEISLNLRWLPGDLQTHLRSQAREAMQTIEKAKGSEKSESQKNSSVKKESFSTQKALQAIDERSAQIMPWWTESEEDWFDLDEASILVESDFDPRQDQSMSLTNSYLLTLVIVLAIKTPTILAAVALGVLSFVYLPICLQDDWRQRSRFEHLLSKLLTFIGTQSDG